MLVDACLTETLTECVSEIYFGSNLVAYKLLKVGRKPFNSSKRVIAWHGTKSKHVASILRHGLLPAGSKLPDGTILRPPDNHYALGGSHQGIENWAGAIFVSPSVLYAAHICYAERIMMRGKRYAVVMEVAVRKGSFTAHESTTSNYKALPGEPENPEYRVEVDDECESQIMRIEKGNAIDVQSLVLIDVEFLEDCPLPFDRLVNLLMTAH